MTNTALRADRFDATTAGPASRPGFFARLRQAYEMHRALREVHMLDDRVLQDIGLSRGQLESAVRGQHYR